MSQHFTNALITRRNSEIFARTPYLESLADLRNDNLVLVTRASAGVGDQTDADWQANGTNLDGIGFFHTTASCELANKVRDQMLGGSDNVFYYDNLGSTDPMVLHRLVLSGWSYFDAGYGLGDMAETSRDANRFQENPVRFLRGRT